MVAALEPLLVPGSIHDHLAAGRAHWDAAERRPPGAHRPLTPLTGHSPVAGPARPGDAVDLGELSVVGLAILAALVFGGLLAVRVMAGQPPAGSWAELRDDPRVPAPASAGPGDQIRIAQPGDTLWALATELAPGADPRPVVDALAEANGGGQIQAGQRLVIPAALSD